MRRFDLCIRCPLQDWMFILCNRVWFFIKVYGFGIYVLTIHQVPKTKNLEDIVLVYFFSHLRVLREGWESTHFDPFRDLQITPTKTNKHFVLLLGTKFIGVYTGLLVYSFKSWIIYHFNIYTQSTLILY